MVIGKVYYYLCGRFPAVMLGIVITICLNVLTPSNYSYTERYYILTVWQMTHAPLLQGNGQAVIAVMQLYSQSKLKRQEIISCGVIFL